jgi:hypothetical protein
MISRQLPLLTNLGVIDVGCAAHRGEQGAQVVHVGVRTLRRVGVNPSRSLPRGTVG